MRRHSRHHWEHLEIIPNWARDAKRGAGLHTLSIEISKEVEALRSERILDLGLGDGRLTKGLLDRSQSIRKLIGIDFSLSMLKSAKESLEEYQHKVHLIQCDIFESVPIRTRIDLVLAARIFHHMDLLSLERILWNIRRSLRKPFHIIIVERWAFEPVTELEWDLRFARERIAEAMFAPIGEFHHYVRDYRAILQRVGFEPEVIKWHSRNIDIWRYIGKLQKLKQPGLNDELIERLRMYPESPILRTALIVSKSLQ